MVKLASRVTIRQTNLGIQLGTLTGYDGVPFSFLMHFTKTWKICLFDSSAAARLQSFHNVMIIRDVTQCDVTLNNETNRRDKTNWEYRKMFPSFSVYLIIPYITRARDSIDSIDSWHSAARHCSVVCVVSD